MPSLSLLLKPASGACNMRCEYCFYRDELSHRQEAQLGRMSEETLEAAVKKALGYADKRCDFGFQGGEPTLRGLDFYRRAVELQRRYNIHGTQITNAIQTNGLLIDQEWADFLAKEGFLVGLSLDGTKDIHDRLRPDSEGKATFSRVMRAAQLLAARGVEVNILTVVTRDAARSVGKIYGAYRRAGLLYQQYIPCLDPLGRERGGESYSLTPELYGRFLRELYALWRRDMESGRPVYIRYFENLMGLMHGQLPESCGMAGQCMLQTVIEADGSVYPCDFYCLDEWKMGNIREQSLRELARSPAAQRFLREGSPGRESGADCAKCRYYPLCRGGCRRDWTEGGNYYCRAYKDFFGAVLG